MPTFRNDGTNAVQYKPVKGGLKQNLEPAGTCETYQMLDKLFPNHSIVRTSDSPYTDRCMSFHNLNFGSGTTKTVNLKVAYDEDGNETINEIRHAKRIVVHAKGAGLTVLVKIDGRLWRKLDVDSGFTYVKIKAQQDISQIQLTTNQAGRVYVYIDRDY